MSSDRDLPRSYPKKKEKVIELASYRDYYLPAYGPRALFARGAHVPHGSTLIPGKYPRHAGEYHIHVFAWNSAYQLASLAIHRGFVPIEPCRCLPFLYFKTKDDEQR